jgi:hypothetical protein
MSEDDDINLGRKLHRAMVEEEEHKNNEGRIDKIVRYLLVIFIIIAGLGYALHLLTGG